MIVKHGVTYRKLKALVDRWRDISNRSPYDAFCSLRSCADELEALYQEDDPGLKERLKEEYMNEKEKPGEIMKFRKKPVVIDAIQWTGENLKEIIDFIGLHESVHDLTWKEYENLVERAGLKIFTLEGSYMAAIGDWIIKGVKGEAYPCKPDILA